MWAVLGKEWRRAGVWGTVREPRSRGDEGRYVRRGWVPQGLR